MSIVYEGNKYSGKRRDSSGHENGCILLSLSVSGEGGNAVLLKVNTMSSQLARNRNKLAGFFLDLN